MPGPRSWSALKVEDIRALNTEEIARQLEAAHRELFDLRFRAATKQLVNHREIPMVKKTIARMETVLRDRELVVE